MNSFSHNLSVCFHFDKNIDKIREKETQNPKPKTQNSKPGLKNP